MSLSESALEDFVASVRERSAGIDSSRAVELRVVEPLLERLGWDVRGPGVDPQVAVGGVEVSYLLSVDGSPSIAVQTAAPGADLQSEFVPALVDALQHCAVDWAIVTDGQRYVLLADDDGDVHRQHHRLDELPDATDALQHYTRAAAAHRAKRQHTDRVDALRRLAANRSEAVEAVTASLASVAGESIEDDARAGAQALVDDLLESAPGDAVEESRDSDATSTPDGAAAVRDESAQPADDQRATDPARDQSSSESSSATPSNGQATATTGSTTGSTTDAATSEDSESASPPAPTARSTDDGEYVVRFFGGNASVGAVGTDNPAGTLAGVVRYLLENQDLASSVTLPWGVQSERAVLAATPEHPDGTAMQYYESIEDRWYVWTGGDEARIRAAIEELAEVAGLRVMFQGDW